MIGLKIGYARVSTNEQDLTAQRDALVELGVTPARIYIDHGLTGTNREHPGLRQALAACRTGDTLVVTKLDRLASSLPDARVIADELTARSVKLSLGGSVHDLTDPVGRLLFVRFGQPTLYTDDIDEMSRFYRVLGFVELFRFPETDTQFATLQKGTFYIALVTYSAIRQSTGIRRIGPSPRFQNDVAILVSDVDGTYQRALAAGGKSLVPPKDQPFGERQAFVVDPAGNLVQISTENGGG